MHNTPCQGKQLSLSAGDLARHSPISMQKSKAPHDFKVSVSYRLLMVWGSMLAAWQMQVGLDLLPAHEAKSLQAVACLPLCSFVARGRKIWQLHEAPLQGAGCCHPLPAAAWSHHRTHPDRCHPCCSYTRAQGGSWGMTWPAVTLPPFHQSLGQRIGA